MGNLLIGIIAAVALCVVVYLFGYEDPAEERKPPGRDS